MRAVREHTVCQHSAGIDVPIPIQAPELIPSTQRRIAPLQIKVLSTMGDDTIGTCVKSSNIIKCIGKNLTMKKKNKVDKLQVAIKNVRRSMRQLGELFIEMDSKTDDALDETTVFTRQTYNLMKDAIISITTNDDGTIKYGKKNCLQYLILESAKILKGSCYFKMMEIQNHARLNCS